MALISFDAVVDEGNFVKEQFPKSAGVDRTEGEFEALITARITEATAELTGRVGPDNYDSTDSVISVVLATAEKYLATAKIYNTMIAIIAAWDANSLPSEFVDIDTCKEQRDWYLNEYRELTGEYAVQPIAVGNMPSLIVKGVEGDDDLCL